MSTIEIPAWYLETSEHVIVWHRDTLRMRLCGNRGSVFLRKSFYQVNPVQTEILYRESFEVCRSSPAKETVVDAYCGTGTIGHDRQRQGRQGSVLVNRAEHAEAVTGCPQTMPRRNQCPQHPVLPAPMPASIPRGDGTGQGAKVRCGPHGSARRSGSTEEFMSLRLSGLSPKPDRVRLLRSRRHWPGTWTILRPPMVTVRRRVAAGGSCSRSPVHVESVVLMQYCGK